MLSGQKELTWYYCDRSPQGEMKVEGISIESSGKQTCLDRKKKPVDLNGFSGEANSFQVTNGSSRVHQGVVLAEVGWEPEAGTILQGAVSPERKQFRNSMPQSLL